MLEQLFFENPWPLIVVLLAAALILRLLARQRGDRRLLLGAMLALLAAGGLWGLAAAVTTDREHVEKLTAQLIHATEGELDIDTLDRLLAADAAIEREDGHVWLQFDQDRDHILTLAQRFRISEHQIRRTITRLPEPDRAVVVLELRSELDRQPGLSVPTGWELTWRRHDQQWQMTRARWTEIRGQSPDQGVLP